MPLMDQGERPASPNAAARGDTVFAVDPDAPLALALVDFTLPRPNGEKGVEYIDHGTLFDIRRLAPVARAAMWTRNEYCEGELLDRHPRP